MTTILLAAGCSTRMGKNKLLLPYKASTIVETTLNTVQPFSDRTMVVIGHDSEIIKDLLKAYDVEFVYNPDYLSGQRSSILAGVSAVKDDDFMVIPGDLPLITKDDVKGTINLLRKFSTARAVYDSIPGHPVAYRKENREKLLGFLGSMKEYLETTTHQAYSASIGAVFDVDTPEKYQLLIDSNPIII